MSDIDILVPSDRRRTWSAQEKGALLAEIDAEGGKVRMVARRHGVSESLLYNWRSARKAAALTAGAPETVQFVPIGLIEGPASCSAVRSSSSTQVPEPAPQAAMDGKVGTIEILLPSGARVSVDASVSEKALTRVLRAMKGMA